MISRKQLCCNRRASPALPSQVAFFSINRLSKISTTAVTRVFSKATRARSALRGWVSIAYYVPVVRYVDSEFCSCTTVGRNENLGCCYRISVQGVDLPPVQLIFSAGLGGRRQCAFACGNLSFVVLPAVVSKAALVSGLSSHRSSSNCR